MDGLIALFIVGCLVIGGTMVLFNTMVFIVESIRMLFNKKYKRQYKLSGKSVDYHRAKYGPTHIDWWGNVRDNFTNKKIG